MSRQPRNPLRWLAVILGRGENAAFVRADLDELFERDRHTGVSRGRSLARYLGGLLCSATALWVDDLRGLKTFRQDARFALRLFARNPLPVAIGALGLALAIGVAAGAFTVVNATMLRPYGMDDPSSVASVTLARESGFPYWPYSTFRRFHEHATLARVEASRGDQVRVAFAAGNDPELRQSLTFASGGYLQMLGGRAVLGRTLAPFDDEPGAAPVVVVSHRFWSTTLQRDPAVIGRRVWVNGTPVPIVGVIQRGFTGPTSNPPAMWAPFAAFDDIAVGQPSDAITRELVEVVARIAAGSSWNAAQDNLSALVAQPDAAGTSGNDRRAVNRAHDQGVRLMSAASPIDGRDALSARIGVASVFGLIALILAAACANTANLLLAASTVRTHEMGVRLALGAAGRRIVSQMVNESLLLAFAAGALGFLVAMWTVPIAASVMELPPDTTTPDAATALFTAVVALLCGLAAGFSPARHGTRSDVLTALKSDSGAGPTGSTRSRLRTSFVAFQAALSVFVLILAVLLTRTAVLMSRVDPGFDVDQLLAVRMERQRAGFDEPAYTRAAAAAVRELPDVQQVSVSQYQPFGSSLSHNTFRHAGTSYDLNITPADADYFSTTGLRIARGRAFTPAEVLNGAPVALISESVARVFFAGADPIGQPLSRVPSETGGTQPPDTIIGIVGDALVTMMDGEVYGSIYRPLAAARVNPPSLIVRTHTPSRTARVIEERLRRLNPDVRVSISIPRDSMERWIGAKRTIAAVALPIALLAFTLATLGVFGVTAFHVGLRRHEISVRLALGSSRGGILRLLVKDNARPVLIGTAIGLCLALRASRLFVAGGMLSGIGPYDPISIVGSLAALGISTCAAVLLPARRALGANPAALLRRA